MSSLVAHTGVGLALQEKIESEAAGILQNELNLNHGYARLAGLLVVFKLNEAWRDLGHGSLNAYILTFAERLGRSPQQIYAYIDVAERLLPMIGEERLNLLGISKASELVRASKKSKKNITIELVTEAIAPRVTVAQVRALAHKTFELGGELPKGKYVDIGGFYVDDESHQTFVDAVKVSMRVLNIPKEMPEWQQRQKIIMFWAQEVLGTYAAEVYGTPTPVQEAPDGQF